MNRAIRAVSGLSTLCALAACGPAGRVALAPGPAQPGRLDAAARYAVLTANSICPVVRTFVAGAGTYGGGKSFSFAVVDDAAGDEGRLAVTIGGVEWRGTLPAVTIDRGASPPIVRITGLVAHPTTGATTPVAITFGGGDAPRLLLDDVAQIVEAFSDNFTGTAEKGSCIRFVGGFTVTATNPLGGTRTSTVTFDLTEDGASDFGTVSFTSNEGDTYTGTSPNVSYDGTDLVIAETIIIPGQLVTVLDIAFRIDLTDGTTAAIQTGTGPLEVPLTSFTTLAGLCDDRLP